MRAHGTSGSQKRWQSLTQCQAQRSPARIVLQRHRGKSFTILASSIGKKKKIHTAEALSGYGSVTKHNRNILEINFFQLLQPFIWRLRECVADKHIFFAAE